MIRVVLVDDEKPARDRMRKLLEAFEDLRVVGEAEDGETAISVISELRPDLVLLDIQMPGRSGLEVVPALAPPRPQIVFCTAFDQYAIDAFELSALDYLLKPINRIRLSRAVQKVRERLSSATDYEREIEAASIVQRRLLAGQKKSVAGLDFVGFCRPARGVGGDYYDFLDLGDGELGVVVGDVSGKGVYAGLLMANLQGRVQSHAPIARKSTGQLMAQINRLMWGSTAENQYATLFYSVYDHSRGSLVYVNAGHLSPIWYRPSAAIPENRFFSLDVGGRPVGLFPDGQYQEGEISLSRNDWLVLFTDGVTEAVNPQDEEFGEQRLRQLLDENRDCTVTEMQERVLQALDQFTDGASQHDDITLVLLRAGK